MKAIAEFEESIKLDSEFGAAYSGLSDAYLWSGINEGAIPAAEAMKKAEEYARLALKIDPDSAEAHASLGACLFTFKFDWTGGERELRQAIELEPNYAYAHDQLNLLLASQGRHDEGLAESERAGELDPLSLTVLMDSVPTLCWERSFERARRQWKKVDELDPTNYLGSYLSGYTELEAGDFHEAAVQLQRSSKLKAPPFVLGYLGYAYGKSGDSERALAQIEELGKQSPNGRPASFNLALIYLGVADFRRAMDCLEKAYGERSAWLIFLKMDRIFDPLRKEPRFHALMRKLNLEK